MLLPILRRFRARNRLNHTVGLWYHPEYAPKCLAQTNRTLGVQLDRSELILDTLAKWRMIRPDDIRPAPLAPLDDLALIHSMTYLESLSSPDVLGYVFGINIAEVSVEELLRSQRRAVGGTINAALAVTRGELKVAVNLGGGFHHAEPEQGGGFCIYNDVAIAIAKLRQSGFREPIAIIDLDYHQGNGNLVTFANDATVLTYSIDGAVWSHIDATANVQVVLPPGTGNKEYLAALKRTLPAALKAHGPKLVFIIAGNDVLSDDPLGDFTLTQEGVADRDQYVIETIRAHGDAGVVVTMAGGYSEKAWQSTASFVHWLLTDRIRLKKWPAQDLRLEFTSIARKISSTDLQRGAEPEEFKITEADILGDLIHGMPAQKLLGYYTIAGIEFALERYGILKKLEERGFTNIEVTADLGDDTRQFVKIYGYGGQGTGRTRHLLSELIVRRRVIAPPSSATGLPGKLELLGVEWLLLQNPTKPFSLARPPLPGQVHPGLGMAQEVLELFRQVCHRLHLDGMCSTPQHYHNAIVGMALGYHFLDPAHEGRLLALKEALGRYTIPEAVVVLAEKRVKLRDGTIVNWIAEGDQILAVSRALKQYFASADYAAAVHAAKKQLLEAGLHAMITNQTEPHRFFS